MFGLNCDGKDGTLVINNVSMNCPAWCTIDLRDLWMPGAIRGGDLLLPGAPGVRARRRRRTVTTYSVKFVISGLAERTGLQPYGAGSAGRMRQLQENLDYLRTNVLDPVTTGNGTRAATLTMPSGATRTALVHVLGLTLSQAWPAGLTTTLDLSIPAGVFV